METKTCTKCFGYGEIQPNVICNRCDGTGIQDEDERPIQFELLEALETMYFNEYGGNSTSIDDAMNRSSKNDPLEQKIIAVIKKAKGL